MIWNDWTSQTFHVCFIIYQEVLCTGFGLVYVHGIYLYFIESVVRQASFISILQNFQPILEGLSVEKSKLGLRDEAAFISHYKKEIWNGCNFRVIKLRGGGIFVPWPCKLKANWGEAGGHTSKLEVVVAL